MSTPDDKTPLHEVLVCRGPECGDRRFAADIAAEFRKLIKTRRLEARVRLDRYCCFGRCQSGPNVLTRQVEPGAIPLYVMPGVGSRLHLGVSPRDVGGILDGLLGGAPAGEPSPAAPPDTLAPRRGSGDD